ncbi:energy transducer TonB [Hymenobacter tibetensis]|uniref:Energy transducer TonB n=1 Tax=Hymenobacter tibetensis TaxID=497967 RepID=A0ABY4CXY0_9BACT|nr:energy transducer TonB [Hymenobacter tibetensis]UOG75123.1 energy transducer TonB [Hymenobacter tibetensis]
MFQLLLFILVSGLCLGSGGVWAQSEKLASTPENLAVDVPVSHIQDTLSNPDLTGLQELKVGWIFVEQMPIYRGIDKKSGGWEGLTRFIQQNLSWPPEAPQESGKVYVSFVIDKSGSIRDTKVVRWLHPAMDAEALRVVQLLDYQFTPAQTNGHPVSVPYTIPIIFSKEPVEELQSRRHR